MKKQKPLGKKVSNSNTISMSSPVEGNLLAFPEPQQQAPNVTLVPFPNFFPIQTARKMFPKPKSGQNISVTSYCLMWSTQVYLFNLFLLYFHRTLLQPPLLVGLTGIHEVRDCVHFYSLFCLQCQAQYQQIIMFNKYLFDKWLSNRINDVQVMSQLIVRERLRLLET